MKLSTELMLANLVILGALWYTALHGMLGITIILFANMVVVWLWARSARRKELVAEILEIKARIKAMIDREAKNKP